MEIKKYATVKEMPTFYPFFSCSALRHIISENRNGFNECLKRVGKRIFIDLEKFQNWMDKQGVG
jgi:hypothetical protein